MSRLAARSILVVALFVLAGALPSAPASAQRLNAQNGVAIHGYDPVAYFTEGRAVAGSEQNAAQHQGATYRFATAANREAFLAEPAKYLPAYGGFCAYAVSKGAVADIDPEAFTIHAGKLYLNYSMAVRETWRQDIPGNTAKADAKWPAMQ